MQCHGVVGPSSSLVRSMVGDRQIGNTPAGGGEEDRAGGGVPGIDIWGLWARSGRGDNNTTKYWGARCSGQQEQPGQPAIISRAVSDSLCIAWHGLLGIGGIGQQEPCCKELSQRPPAGGPAVLWELNPRRV